MLKYTKTKVPSVINQFKRFIVDVVRTIPRWQHQRKLKQQWMNRSFDYFEHHLKDYLDLENGFFIELGANDGIRFSNTLWLEKHRNWQGLLIEPIPRLYKMAKKNRPKATVVNTACVAFDYPDDEIKITDVGLMSIVDGAMSSEEQLKEHILTGQKVQQFTHNPKFAVPAQALSSILQEHQITHIDFLSLDVEGYEYQVLKGLDLERHRPRYILVEDTYDEHNQIHDHLASYYTIVKHVDDSNTLYTIK